MASDYWKEKLKQGNKKKKRDWVRAKVDEEIVEWLKERYGSPARGLRAVLKEYYEVEKDFARDPELEKVVRALEGREYEDLVLVLGDIARALGVDVNEAGRVLTKLNTKGYLWRENGKYRIRRRSTASMNIADLIFGAI